MCLTVSHDHRRDSGLSVTSSLSGPSILRFSSLLLALVFTESPPVTCLRCLYSAADSSSSWWQCEDVCQLEVNISVTFKTFCQIKSEWQGYYLHVPNSCLVSSPAYSSHTCITFSHGTVSVNLTKTLGCKSYCEIMIVIMILVSIISK